MLKISKCDYKMSKKLAKILLDQYIPFGKGSMEWWGSWAFMLSTDNTSQ